MSYDEPPADLILVITNPCDEVADRVIHELRQRDCRVARFDPAELPLRSTITTGSGTDGIRSHIYRPWGTSIQLDKVSSVWYRRPGSFVLPPYTKGHIANFARSELSVTLGGILRSLNCLWVNHPSAIVEAGYKAEQIARAGRMGLRVPDTCITTQPAHAKAFFTRHDGQLIIKVLGDSDIYAPEEGPGIIGNIMTTVLHQEDFAKLERVAEAPVLLQEHVLKQSDLRVVVVGETLFSVSIESQSDDDSRVDWRRVGPELPHHVVTLPEPLQHQLKALTRSYGLTYAAIDLIHAQDGGYVFLEINPNGEWGWLERVTDLDITRAIADVLASGASGATVPQAPPGEARSAPAPAGTEAS